MYTPRQLELIDAAITLTSRQGIQRLTIRNVANHIGISEAAVYRHFESKYHLLLAVLSHLDGLLSPLFDELANTEQQPAAAVSSFLDTLCSLIEANKAFTLMVFAEETFNVEPLLKSELLALLQSNISRLAEFFAKAQNAGTCRSDIPADQLALVTFGAIRLSVSRWHLNGIEHPLSTEAHRLHHTFTTMFSLT